MRISSFLCATILMAGIFSPFASEQVDLDELRQWLGEGRYDEIVGQIDQQLDPTQNARLQAELQNLAVEALWRGGKAREDTTLARAEKTVELWTELGDQTGLAQATNSLGVISIQRGDTAAAERLFGQTLKLREAIFGPDHPEVAKSLNNLAILAVRRGDFRGAREQYERSLAIREEMYGTEDIRLTRVMSNLANVLQRLGEHDRARVLYERVLTIRLAAHGEDHPDVGLVRHNLGTLLEWAGEFEAAAGQLQKAIAIREKHNGPDSPPVAQSGQVLARVEAHFGNFDRAEELLDSAEKILVASFGAEHPEVARCLTYRGIILEEQGDFLGAQEKLQQAVDIYTAALGPEHYDLSNPVYLLGKITRNLGDYGNAYRHYELALRIQQRDLGEENREVAGTLNGLAVLSAALGYRERAQQYYDRALAVVELTLGPSHRDVASMLLGRAALQTDPAVAREDIRRALTITRETFGENHAATAGPLQSLAGNALASGDLATARSAAEEAVAILSAAGGVHQQLVRPLLTLAVIDARSGGMDAARTNMRRALQVAETRFGPQHPLSATARVELAFLETQADQQEKAVLLALEAESIRRSHLRDAARDVAEASALYLARRQRPLDLALSIGVDSSTMDPSTIFDALIRSRAVVLDEVARRQQELTRAGTGEVLAAARALHNTRTRLANMVLAGPGEVSDDRYDGLLKQTRVEKQRLERQLAATLSGGLASTATQIGLREILDGLPDGAALVSYVRFQRQSLSLERVWKTTPAYAAFIISDTDKEPALVLLGTADRIDNAVNTWREALLAEDTDRRRREANYRTAATELASLIWEPIAGRLAKASQIIIVPDGSLHSVDLAVLPAGRRSYVVEQVTLLRYLPAERDLIGAPAGTGTARGLLAMGGVDYQSSAGTLLVSETDGDDAQKTPTTIAQATTDPNSGAARFRGVTESCPEMESLRFAALQATGAEASAVAGVWKNTGREGDVLLLQGDSATEGLLKARAAEFDVLHLATHGFFIEPDCRRRLPGEPLLYSGLVLAGANDRTARGSIEDDGLLTAEEIASLPLEGVRLAVLSACDSGRGSLQAGEGVLGMSRAFLVAGVHSLVLSLWPVEDRITRQWMDSFYDAHLGEGLETAAAVRAASLDLLEQGRRSGRDTHPISWAGFVALAPPR